MRFGPACTCFPIPGVNTVFTQNVPHSRFDVFDAGNKNEIFSGRIFLNCRSVSHVYRYIVSQAETCVHPQIISENKREPQNTQH